MRILFDNGTPRGVAAALPDHSAADVVGEVFVRRQSQHNALAVIDGGP